jgi:hypothetical protein
MHYAKKKYQKIKSGRVMFSPEASLWIRRTQVYSSLLKYHARRIRNGGNLKQTVRWCNIPDAMSLSIEEIYFRLKACVNQCNYFKKHGKYYQQKHLYNRLEAAKEKRMKILNNKSWQLFIGRRTGASSDVSIMCSASHRQEHASKYRLSKVKEW